MTQFQKKSFSVPMSPRKSDEERMEEDGYEKHPAGFYMKCKIPADLRVPQSCGSCGKNYTNELSKMDIPYLDDYNMCKNCYIKTIEGREKRLIEVAAAIIVDPHSDDSDVHISFKFLKLRGVKRWVKNNWPEQYEAIYDNI